MTFWKRLKLCWHILTGVPLIGEGETTSAEVASIASRGLRRPTSLTDAEIRAVCASALTQAPNKR
jgi:hypothetical protein